MNKSKIIVAVAGVAVVAAAYFGIHGYRNYKRECADRRSAECLGEFARLVGDGQGAVPVEKLKPLLAEMAALSGECSKGFADDLVIRRLDGAFLIGDYAQAEQLLDAMPGRSANWKEGAKAKLRAHAALERGDKAAAIGEFEKFCQTLVKEGLDAVEGDPSTGVMWTHEGLLAKNLKRMSVLAAEIGDKERSAKFLAEARRHAKLAVQKPDADEGEKKALADEIGPLE